MQPPELDEAKGDEGSISFDASDDGKAGEIAAASSPPHVSGNDDIAGPEPEALEDAGAAMSKRKLEDDDSAQDLDTELEVNSSKKPKIGQEEEDGSSPVQVPVVVPAEGEETGDSGEEPPLVPASTVGMMTYSDNDVLSGRGGGTNVHQGNRNFRDLINLHRRTYLKARKNDKPAISRAIVRAIRASKGRFLRKDEKTGLWFEIGDDAAREKTSQALRQRAPEMRKLLFDTEREEARVAAQEHMRNQRLLMGMHPDHQGAAPTAAAVMMSPTGMPAGSQPILMNPVVLAQMAKAATAAGTTPSAGVPQPGGGGGGGGGGGMTPEAYQQMYAAAFQGGMFPFTPHVGSPGVGSVLGVTPLPAAAGALEQQQQLPMRAGGVAQGEGEIKGPDPGEEGPIPPDLADDAAITPGGMIAPGEARSDDVGDSMAV